MSMFILYTLKVQTELEPELLGLNIREAITLKLEERFIGKVLKNEGVCVAIYSFEIEQTFVRELYLESELVAKIVVFKPFIGEILTGKIKESNSEGITVSMVFIDALIPAAYLADPSGFDEQEGVFVWHFDEHDLFYDIGETIRFKVHAFALPFEDSASVQLLGRANEDGLGLLQWWVTS
ncbi:unnamed protein product [Blepharisma stoltei]|uniref:S1 motif domain-containing protein n=1 Tax=Blepharisma stoltei TaxID=1481888 RepID=A0AAU9JZE5_9CILI|nr:unnamed protein product [Blepharisma stoltei]